MLSLSLFLLLLSIFALGHWTGRRNSFVGTNAALLLDASGDSFFQPLNLLFFLLNFLLFPPKSDQAMKAESQRPQSNEEHPDSAEKPTIHEESKPRTKKPETDTNTNISASPQTQEESTLEDGSNKFFTAADITELFSEIYNGPKPNATSRKASATSSIGCRSPTNVPARNVGRVSRWILPFTWCGL
jgi:hypothetical protein